jgi:primosomal protein N' (replication factor Y)
MKERYGSTMNQALKTVLPVKQKVKESLNRVIRCLLTEEELCEAENEAERKHFKARARLLHAFHENKFLPYQAAVNSLGITAASLKPLEESGVIAVEVAERYRNPLAGMAPLTEGTGTDGRVELTPAQRQAAETMTGEYSRGIRNTYLIHGVTGSGKTEVYMEFISHVVKEKKQVIMLIPEISLTWQTVMRFYKRFGNRVSVLHSRMSAGERYDQYERARTGDIDIIIGPRSALFAPFQNLGLIIIDEEHENSYKSELSPRYDARETAAMRAKMSGAALVLGSATPSLESYTKALKGEYRLLTLKERARASAALPTAEIVDLREELKAGNRSIFSRRLKELIEDRLEKGEQTMLFINRRGYATFVSCRSCGEALKCPHCDVTLTLHRDGMMRCHYCGYTVPQPKRCPSCSSPYIAPFGTGTQKIEEMAGKMFPQARILRMDFDTTSKKGGHQEILSAFGRGEADILIGTQMIVKGHDFPKVTLVGALAADLSLYASDYRCTEETFNLLTQAAGRAGRGEKAGCMVIQTYQPDHYSIQAAAAQDYERFYDREMAFRKMLGYPPAVGLLTIQLQSKKEELLARAGESLTTFLPEDLAFIGPVNAPVYKVNDIYRKFLYIKHENYDILIQIRKMAEQHLKELDGHEYLTAFYDLE